MLSRVARSAHGLLPLATLALLMLGGCGKRSADVKAQAPPAVSPTVVGMPALPAPADLSDRTSSAVRLQADGSDLFDVVPPRNFSVAGELGVFTPYFDPDAPAGGTVGFGVYQLNDPSLSGAHFVRYTGASHVFEQSMIWIGLANFDTNRWDWRNAATLSHPNYVDLPDVAPYIASDGSLLVAFVIMGDLPFKLHRVGVTAFDEFEDNDSLVSASLIPHRVMCGLHGSLGTGPGYPGMDGDNTDIWRLDTTGHRAFTARLAFNPSGSDFKLEALLSDGTLLRSDDSASDGSLFVYEYNDFADGGVPIDDPMYLRITCVSGFSHYMLDVTTGTPPEGSHGIGVTPPEVTVGELVTFSTAAIDPDGYIYRYSWHTDFFGDDPVYVTRTPWYKHTYDEPGDYFVVLSMIDDDGFGNDRPNGEGGLIVHPE